MPKEIPSEMPAGHEREEATKRVADQLAEKIETNAAQSGLEAIDPSKLAQRDNEILRHVGQGGVVDVSNMQPGFRYAFMPTPAQYRDARSAIRMMISSAQSNGWHAVKEDMPEGREIKGNDAAETSSLRGVGDCVLYRIREEDAAIMDAKQQRKQQRSSAIEDQSRVFASERGIGANYHAVAGDFRQDPEMARRFSVEQSSPVTMRATSTFTEGDLHRGSISGIPSPGSR